ncbi:hypothetical protein EDM68_00405 [Candidatus Uhrbacteria bacterium]|nr:MAG: hypothetical protein EDM68_00405 [Candidatus Uhrbacteria bacterium]
MSPDIVRSLIGGLLCAALLLAFGFLPVWLDGGRGWAESNASDIAMPIGESKTAELRAPYEFNAPAGVGLPRTR